MRGILVFEAFFAMKHQERIVVWLQKDDMAGFKICIYTSAIGRKWLPVVFSRACAQAAVFSILNAHYQI